MPFFPNAKAAVDDSIDKAKQRLEGPQQPVDDLTSSLNGLSLDAHSDDDDGEGDEDGEGDDGEGDHEGEDSDDDTIPPAATTTDTKEVKKRQPPTTPPPNNTPVLTASSSINTDDTDTLVRDLQALVVDMESSSSSSKPQQVQRPLDELTASPDTSKPRQQPSLAELMAAAQFGIE